MTNNIVNRVSLAVALALSSGATALAQEVSDDSEVELVEVTGSRIKRTELEGISPITVITSEDILSQGHATVFDALNSLSINTGIFVGEENSNNFNANAQAVNLRGFGPGYTLVLINGRRVPVLPKPSGAVAGNVVNLAMIPTEAIERVEVLSGGASAIYGSDAVAGVVNIILKKTMDGSVAKYRYGDTKDGGGQSHRLNLATGGKVGDVNYIAGLEINRADPIRGNDRDWFDEPSDGPDASRHNLSQVMSYWARYQPDPWMLIDLRSQCEQQGYEPQQPGWVNPFDEDPYFCGDNVYSTYTIRNERNRTSGFVHLDYEINDDTELKVDLLVTNSSADAGLYRYGYSADYDVLDDDGNWLASRHIYRTFRDYETPTSNQEFDETSYTLMSGINGTVLEDYEYNVNLTLSRYDYEDSVVRFNDQQMLSLLFGTKGEDWDQPWEGARWATVNQSQLDDKYLPTQLNFFGDLNPEMFTSALHTSIGQGESWTYNLSADIAGDLYDLPAGAIQFAGVFEFINEGYEFITDAPTVNGDIWGWSGIVGEGERNHFAVGAEFLVPILSQDSAIGSLEATAAARYDRYNDESLVGGATTYQLGLTWKPTDALMVRASKATSFRAPDMHYLYAQRSSSFTSGVDFKTCIEETGIQQGDSWLDCTGENYGTGSVRRFTQGDLTLKEETGYSANFGIVADLTDDWDFSIDYYKIQLNEQVGLIGTSAILLFEAECTYGFNLLGEDVDVNSARCQEVLSRVTRGGREDSVTGTVASPFNTGMREQTGMDIATRYDWENTAYGDFYVSLKYTHIFETLVRFLPTDEVEDIRDFPYNNEFRTRTNLTLGWDKDDHWGAIFVNRLGTSPINNATDGERYSAWTRVNLSGGFKYNEALSFSVSVNNLFNKRPHQHETERFWPFADVSKYNPVGTEYFITARYKF